MIPYEPTKISMPFAYNGARNEIPTEGGEDTGNASLDLGFPPITSQPLSQGGIPPQRKDFNGILYILSAYAHYAQSGALYSYDEAVDYITNCIITYGNNIYICIANNGPSTGAGVVTPGTNESYWMTLYAYLQSGDTSDVGSGVNPVYVVGGKMVASTASVGGTAQPVRLNNGVITALTATVGADDTPVYLKSGVLTACTSSGGGIADYKAGMPGYIKYDCGIIVQWGDRTTTGSTSVDYTVTFPVAFSSASSYVIMKNCASSHTSWTSMDADVSFYSKAKQSATTHASAGSKNGSNYINEEWFAIGY